MANTFIKTWLHDWWGIFCHELKQIFSDIYDDSEWLIDLAENLLSISRIENGQMELHMSLEVVGDVIDEALRLLNENDGKTLTDIAAAVGLTPSNLRQLFKRRFGITPTEYRKNR